MDGKSSKVSFSIVPSKPKPANPTARPAAFSVAAVPHTAPAPQFISAFDPSEPVTPPAPPAVVIPPLPNTRKPPSTVPTGDGPAFVPDASDNNPSSSTSATYGLAVRGDTEEESKRRKVSSATDAAATRRFKQDMAVLPDTQDTNEYEEVPVEGFGAALLAGYGWKEGTAIGRDKSKPDVKVVEHGRRSGTQGLGADDASDKRDPAAVRPAVPTRSVRDLRVACFGTTDY